MESVNQSEKLTCAINIPQRIASRLINACLMHVSQVSGLKRTKEKNYVLLDDLWRFRLWAHGFDTLPSESPALLQDTGYPTQLPKGKGDPEEINEKFDEILECSEYLKERTIVYLVSFASCLLLTKFKKSTPPSTGFHDHSVNYTAVGNNFTRALMQAALNDAMTIYPTLRNDWGDADSDQSWMSATQELHDIVGSLFTLAEPLNEVLENLKSHTNLGLPPLMESYKNLIIDMFPNAELHLVLRFAEGNTECHEQLRNQARPEARYGDWNSVANKFKQFRGLTRGVVLACVGQIFRTRLTS